MNDAVPLLVAPKPKPRRGRRWGFRFAVMYLLFVSALAVSLVWADEMPLPTLLAFGPRWPWAVPLALFALLGLVTRSWRIIGVVIVSTVVVAWPLMGAVVNPGTWGKSPSTPTGLRIMTWNCAGAAPGPRFRNALEALSPDVVLLQEQSGFGAPDFPSGWSVTDTGMGVLTASRYPIRSSDGTIGPAEFGRPGRCRRDVLDTPHGPLTVVNCHLPTARTGIEAAISSKLRDLTELRSIIADRDHASAVTRQWVGDPSGLVVVAGDFNTPTDSAIYRRHWGGYQNAYSVAGNGYGGTKITTWHRLRIDHILFNPPFRCTHAFVGPDLGSDHLPMIAELGLLDSPP